MFCGSRWGLRLPAARPEEAIFSVTGQYGWCDVWVWFPRGFDCSATADVGETAIDFCHVSPTTEVGAFSKAEYTIIRCNKKLNLYTETISITLSRCLSPAARKNVCKRPKPRISLPKVTIAGCLHLEFRLHSSTSATMFDDRCLVS